MKKPLFVCLSLLCAMLLYACVPMLPQASRYAPLFEPFTSGGGTTSIDSPAGLPSNFSEFKSRCQTMSRSPEGAVKMYFDAVFCYLEPGRRAEASKMLRYIMHADAGWESSQKYVTFVRRLKDPACHYIFRSFASGTSPENGYRMSPEKYSLVFSDTSQEADYVRVFLISSGSDSRRIVWVKQYQDGLWYVINNADTYMKVREPARSRPDNSHDADYDNR